ncbi:MAG TPA: hypothetical protein VNN22_05220 [Verrucomicrobiae bacterium]|nr:hypothetical protein [Verrucomicrobiae bacterium]
MLLSAGCSRSSNEIEKVLVARARAQAQLIHTARIKLELTGVAGGNPDALLISPVRYAEALQRIDVSRCPSDFKTVWKNYITAWQSDDGNPGKYYSVKVVPESIGDPSPVPASDQTNDPAAKQNHAERRAAWLNLKQHLHGAIISGDDF